MNLYLSRLLLDPRSRRVQQELAHPYEMHRTLLRAFPGEDPTPRESSRGASGMLFRADQDPLRHAVTLYVQSLTPPDWTFLETLGAYLDAAREEPVACKDVFAPYQSLQEGRLLAFRLRANPTKRVGSRDASNRGKRVELFREEEQIAWLERKGENGGFKLDALSLGASSARVPRVEITPEGKRYGRKVDKDGIPQDLVHSSVLFEGFLRITDPEAFRQTVACGIGSGKALGFGLLSLAPGRSAPER